MRFLQDTKLDFCDVLLCPKRSTLESRKDADLIRKFIPKYGKKFEGVPIIAANMSTGNFNMLNVLSENRMFTAIAKHHNAKWLNENGLNNKLLYGFYTIGMKEDDLDNLKEFNTWLKTRDSEPSMLKICIDIANGYTQKFSDFVSKVRNLFPDNTLVAGNVCTPEMVQELIIAGADYVKCGVGPGSACKTRFKTGVGFPQWSVGVDCSDAAHGLGGGIILDGGMSTPSDICKAFGTGADLVMLGGMFSGTDECDGNIIEKRFLTNELDTELKQIIEVKKYKFWYGMASNFAMTEHFDGKKEYKTSEGLEELVEYKGSVKNIVEDILGSIRSCMTYIGARTIKDIPKCASFIRCTRQHSRF
jgi:GMP reductase